MSGLRSPAAMSVLALLCLFALSFAFGCGGSGGAAPAGTAEIKLVPVAYALAEPTSIANAGDGSGRLFVTERRGKVRVINGTNVFPKPFLDLTQLVVTDRSAPEQGLLGLAFHPQYKTNGYFYVAYTRRGAGLGEGGDVVIAEYHVSADPNVADPASGRTLLVVEHYDIVGHNGGQLAFGPDGNLYIGIGDADIEHAPEKRAQNLDVMVGKILRITVPGGDGYSIPATNPFVGRPGQDEIWAYGLRNPWRFSFDRLTGDLYIGDVGESLMEEVDFQPAGDAGGENYGWSIIEGTRCGSAPEACRQGSLVPPILAYEHAGGNCAVIGGYVYRGKASTLDGTYVYGDLCTGIVWGARKSTSWTAVQLLDTDHMISTFGEDESGQIYLADINKGNIYRIEAPPAAH